jgi:putative endopeptidase
LPTWKTYLRWHLVTPSARLSRPPFVTADFDFYSKYLRGVQGDAAALEALRAARGSATSAKRWARCSSKRPSRRETKASAVAMTQEIEAAMESEIEAALPG